MRWTLVIVLLCAGGCRTTPSVAGSEAPLATAVGPVPGPASAVREAANPYENDPVALQNGQRLFNWFNCSGCHGGHAGGGMGPSLRDETWIYGSRPDQIFDTIAQGRAHGMPAWGSKIPEDQIWQLVAYIKSLRTAQEPDAPVIPKDEDVLSPDFKSPVKTDSPPVY